MATGPRRGRALGLAAAVLMTIDISAADDGNTTDAHTAVCRGCLAEPQFASAALNMAPIPAPAPDELLTYPVYFINPAKLELRFYGVLVRYQRGGRDSQSASSRNGADVTADAGARWVLSRSAVPGSGDLELIEALKDAVLTGKAFLASLEHVDVGDLPFPAGRAPGSAIDLIVPEGPASLASRELGFRLQDHLESRLADLLAQSDELQQRLLMDLITPSAPFNTTLADVGFPDGTSITVEITAVQFKPVLVQAEVHRDSGRMPNGAAIPQSPGQFIGYDFTGPPDVGQSLVDLLDRFGVPVPGGEPDCDYSCESRGDNPECSLSCREE